MNTLETIVCTVSNPKTGRHPEAYSKVESQFSFFGDKDREKCKETSQVLSQSSKRRPDAVDEVA